MHPLNTYIQCTLVSASVQSYQHFVITYVCQKKRTELGEKHAKQLKHDWELRDGRH
jgi:hypothetical protein